MTDSALKCIVEQGFAVRPLPSPTYLRGHTVALMHAEHAQQTLDLNATPIPVLDLAVSDRWSDALWTLAESAAALRSRTASGGDDNGDAPTPIWHVTFGAGPTAQAATLRAGYVALTRHAAPADELTGTLVLGWEHEVPILREVDGSIDCYLLNGPRGVSTIGAVVHLARSVGHSCAVACDISPRRALRQAVTAALRKLAAWSLAQSQHGIKAEADEVTVNQTGQSDYRDLIEPRPVNELESLRAALQESGLRAFIRNLGPDRGPTVVTCRIESASAAQRREVDVLAMNLRAPTQSSLTYSHDNVSIGRMFHENSKMRRAFSILPGVELGNMALPARRLLAHAHRDFEHCRREYALPKEPTARPRPLDECLRTRRSWAPMDSASIGFNRLAQVLLLAYGTTGNGAAGDGLKLPLRATPSAGGLYSTDIFVLADRVTGVEPGLYYLHPARQVLQLVRSDRLLGEVAEQTGYADRVAQAAALLIYVGAFRRNQWKYWERGYRTVLLDCGHLAQSVVTAANALDLVAHPMIGYVDNYFNDLVGVDGIDDAVLYLTLLAPARRIQES